MAHIKAVLKAWIAPAAKLLRPLLLTNALLVISASISAGQITYNYDEAGRLKTVTNAGTQTTYSLDAAGNRTNVTSALSKLIQFTVPSATQTENGGNYSIIVKRTGDPSGAVGVSYTVTGIPAGTPNYSVAAGSLSWASGDVADKSIPVTITNDSVYQGNESVTITLSSPTGGAQIGTQNTFTLSITEDDPIPHGTLALAPTAYSVVEGATNVVVTVTRTGGSMGAVSINYATSNGTATAGSDYTAASGTLSWADGDAAAKTFNVAILNDSVFEPSETVNLGLTGVTGGASLGAASGAITIIDNQRGTLQFTSGTPISVSESVGSVTFQISRANGAYGTASVACHAVSGTVAPIANVGSDFSDPAVTLSWADGEVGNKACIVPIVNDSTPEWYCTGGTGPDVTCTGIETFSVQLSGAAGAALGSASTAFVNISDDDETSPPLVPTGLTASRVSATQVNLNWSPSSDVGIGYVSGLAGYKVYRAGALLATTASTSYSDTNASSNLAYTIAAYDNAGNVSAQSTPPVTPIDNIAPSTPTGFTATALSYSQITLSWNSSTDTGGSGLSGYRITRINDNTTFSTTSTTFADTGLNASTAYSYYVAAVDNQGNVSSQAGPVSATTQAPPSYTDNETITSGFYLAGTYPAYSFYSGFESPPPVFGSMTPTTLTGGKVVTGFFDGLTIGTSGVIVTGFTSDPGKAWLTSATANGVTKTGASSFYSYGSGQAAWSWSSLFGFPSSGTVSSSIVHAP